MNGRTTQLMLLGAILAANAAGVVVAHRHWDDQGVKIVVTVFAVLGCFIFFGAVAQYVVALADDRGRNRPQLPNRRRKLANP